jgi:hypothetical protein
MFQKINRQPFIKNHMKTLILLLFLPLILSGQMTYTDRELLFDLTLPKEYSALENGFPGFYRKPGAAVGLVPPNTLHIENSLKEPGFDFYEPADAVKKMSDNFKEKTAKEYKCTEFFEGSDFSDEAMKKAGIVKQEIGEGLYFYWAQKTCTYGSTPVKYAIAYFDYGNFTVILSFNFLGAKDDKLIAEALEIAKTFKAFPHLAFTELNAMKKSGYSSKQFNYENFRFYLHESWTNEGEDFSDNEQVYALEDFSFLFLNKLKRDYRFSNDKFFDAFLAEWYNSEGLSDHSEPQIKKGLKNTYCKEFDQFEFSASLGEQKRIYRGYLFRLNDSSYVSMVFAHLDRPDMKLKSVVKDSAAKKYYFREMYETYTVNTFLTNSGQLKQHPVGSLKYATTDNWIPDDSGTEFPFHENMMAVPFACIDGEIPPYPAVILHYMKKELDESNLNLNKIKTQRLNLLKKEKTKFTATEKNYKTAFGEIIVINAKGDYNEDCHCYPYREYFIFEGKNAWFELEANGMSTFQGNISIGFTALLNAVINSN